MVKLSGISNVEAGEFAGYFKAGLTGASKSGV